MFEDLEECGSRFYENHNEYSAHQEAVACATRIVASITMLGLGDAIVENTDSETSRLLRAIQECARTGDTCHLGEVVYSVVLKYFYTIECKRLGIDPEATC